MAGNEAFVASDGWVFDTKAPGVFGVEEGVTYYVDTAVTVSDKNLLSVTCNGEEMGASFTMEGGVVGEYVIVATDKAGNRTTVCFATGKLEDAGAVLEGLTPENMTKADEEAVRELLKDLEKQDLTDATEEEKAAVTELIAAAKKLLPAATPNTGDLLLPIAGAVCVIALVGIAVILILKKKYAK